jgi:hypothetical protein
MANAPICLISGQAEENEGGAVAEKRANRKHIAQLA